MPNKMEILAQMADQKAVQLTSSWQEWAAFLTTAARLYKYPYHEQLMIFAQRPDATACAEYDLWNDKMGRYVRRGSKGIALLDDSGDKPRLRYVFDVSDTGTLEHSRSPRLWQMDQRYLKPVSDTLERRYEAEGTDLAQQLTSVAQKLAANYWNDHQRDIRGIVDDSFLEEYDEFNLGVQFKAATTVSVAYALMSRCGLEPEQFFEHEDFMSIFDFNTPATVAALGTAVSQINQQVLRQIGVTILNAEREAVNERRTQDEKHPDLHAERRLSDSESEPERAAVEALGQVRQDAQGVSEGTSAHPVQSDAAERETVSSLPGDRGNGEAAAGRDDAAAGAGSRSDRGAESQRPDEVGGADEHLQGADRGDSAGGAYQQLTLNLFLSEAEQIHNIDEAENVKTSSAFSFAQTDIDHVLRLGGNTDRQRERVAAELSKQKSVEENAAYLQSVFRGGNGITTENGRITAWYAKDGIHLSRTKSARYDKSAQVVSWESTAERIGQLLEEGSYATNVELAEAPGYERSRLAEKLWYLTHELSEEARGKFLTVLEAKGPTAGFPGETAWLSQQLTDPEFRAKLSKEYKQFLEAYGESSEILRFRYHRPKEIGAALADLELPRKTFETEMTKLPVVSTFITEDELDAALSGGSGMANGKSRIFAFFAEGHTAKEKADFLKHEYGTGGRSHALSGATGSSEDHDAKGERFQKQDCPEVKLTWEKVAERIEDLIRKHRYLSAEELQAYEQVQAEKELAESEPAELQEAAEVPVAPQLTTSAISSYNDTRAQHPDDIVLYQVGDFFEMYGEDARKAAAELELMLTTRAVPGAGRVFNFYCCTCNI